MGGGSAEVWRWIWLAPLVAAVLPQDHFVEPAQERTCPARTAGRRARFPSALTWATAGAPHPAAARLRVLSDSRRLLHGRVARPATEPTGPDPFTLDRSDPAYAGQTVYTSRTLRAYETGRGEALELIGVALSGPADHRVVV